MPYWLTMAIRKEQLHGGRALGRAPPISLRIVRFLFARVGAVFPALLGRWAYSLWFRTRRFPQSAAGRQVTLNAAHEIVQVGHVPVAVYSWGSGPVVLFVHGWSGRGSQVAAFIEPLLDAGFRVVAPDLPGHGTTPGHSTNILECAEVLQAIQQRYGKAAAVLTHSFGGMVLAYAMNHGLHAQCAVCIAAPADARFLIDGFAQTLDMHPSVVTNLCKRLEKRFEHDFWERISTECNVRKLSTPALVVHDLKDSSVPWQQGERIASAWPGAQFMKTQGLGHGRILQDAAVIDVAVSFVTRTVG
ncbi:MAG: alpha/beta hydrolase [Gammaproteobacteria bacterium]|nr:alpha/beta hydrolase [Gammaproteobacteria bacterium]